MLNLALALGAADLSVMDASSFTGSMTLNKWQKPLGFKFNHE